MAELVWQLCSTRAALVGRLPMRVASSLLDILTRSETSNGQAKQVKPSTINP